ncbi:MAG TPA: hypothetical protein VHJ18_06460 [Streptosporangiaceae bacterium]|jgi:hypothetical protein|nr:hypothetical protein [Streptosporangiaceae bacterium]
MSESVPGLPEMSKAEHFLSENEFAAIGFAVIDAVAHLDRIWRMGSGGCLPGMAIRRL